MKLHEIIAKALGAEIREIWPSLNTAKTLRDHLNDMGYEVSYNTVREVLIELGLKRTHRRKDPSARALAVIDCREATGDTYEAIGQKHGIGRERVRQILQRWRPDLTGREDTSVTVTCLNCETQHQRTPYKANDGARQFCNRACFVEYCAKTPTDIERRLLDTALAMRPEATWREVGAALGLNGRNHMNLPTRVKQIAAKTGEDVSSCFTRAQ